MIIFLYGPDTYRSRQKLNEIIEHYQKIHKSGLNLKILDLKEGNFQDFQNEVQSVSMFAEKKLIVLKDALGNKNFLENFLKNSKKFVESKDIILFYEKGEVPKDKFTEFLKKYGKSQEFQLLNEERLKNWIIKEFESYKVKIEPKALELLISYVGSNLWQMSNEIRKLVNYKRGEKIKKEDVELLVKPKIETDIFKTIDALASKDKKQALELIHKHLEKGDSPLYLLSMINFQFRNLLITKDLIQKYRSPYILSKVTHLHPYIIKKSYSLTQKFTIQELKKIYQKIYQTDLNIKTGKIELETALDLLIAEM
jgi:DNA polymerase-3 subunit delta